MGVLPIEHPGTQGRTFAEVIENFLKWFSIAYGLGFITVMFHTVPFGIPILELAEPVQIWVGLPLAAVFWAVLEGYKFLTRKRRDLKANLVSFQADYDRFEQLAQSGDIAGAMNAFGEAFASAFIHNVTLLSPSWMSNRLAKAMGSLFAKGLLRTYNAKPKDTVVSELKAARRLIVGMTTLLHVTGFLNRTINIFLPLVGLALIYIFLLYPRIPQSWGGGEPVTVTMLLSEEKIPLDDPILKPLFQHRDAKLDENTRLTSPVRLLYSNDHAYYVALGNQTLRISSEAIGGVIFAAPGHY